MAGRSILVKVVLTSVVISFITVLDVPLEDFLKIGSIRRAYLWAACEKVTGGSAKLIGNKCANPKNLEGFAS